MDRWPVAVWIVLICAAWFVGQYVLLYRRWIRTRPEAKAAEQRLSQVAARLRAYAMANARQLPDRLDKLGGRLDERIAYRPVPSLEFDERLILLHDAQPTRNLLQFPSLRPGRGVVLCNGRLLELTEEAFEKLIQADDRLRQELGLKPLAPPTEAES